MTRDDIVRLMDWHPVAAMDDLPDSLLARVETVVRAAEAAERAKWQPVVNAVLREMPRRDRNDGNAPGHAHAVPGIWDPDNGPLAGRECAWCKAWNTAKAVTLTRDSP